MFLDILHLPYEKWLIKAKEIVFCILEHLSRCLTSNECIRETFFPTLNGLAAELHQKKIYPQFHLKKSTQPIFRSNHSFSAYFDVDVVAPRSLNTISNSYMTSKKKSKRFSHSHS